MSADDKLNGRGALDLSFLRGAAKPRATGGGMSRRNLFRGAGAVAGAGALASVASACSIQGTQTSATAADATDWYAWWAGKKLNGQFSFDNWAAYIDQDKNGNHPSLDTFTKKTGIKVTYDDAAVTDTATYYGKIAPSLAAGKPIGADLFVMTNGWEFTELVNNGYVAALDNKLRPNFLRNADESVLSPSYDFNSTYSAVWQSGYTGIAYHSDLVDGEITSWEDLTKAQYKNQVAMFGSLDELSQVGLLVNGVTPSSSTKSDWEDAADWLTNKLSPNVKKFYDQGYLDAFKSKQMAITQAWSGDILAIQANFPKVKFVFPEEGFGVWHDNMMIPVTAENPLDAMTWINYYYQTSVASVIEDWIWYKSPVVGVREYIRKVIDDPDYVNSELAFPPSDVLARAYEYVSIKDRTTYDTYTSIFNPVVQGS
ncbi:spermidine/putrescine ABC transporter substrate-binding protein [Nocardioides sp. GY 10127]|uniref:polyamine ABC transporter substrate-binding protein n=1 Tax=Nocardioides sp. GY 10127 TaxID=2569762 RepID=UPI0010A8A693|nr:spermidine/putrescine ABC transporter substrate-binding protein [Nocardioides sp. GY 10127]TIC85644.1 spermidine/putrescine ABC transporter substrate-binding protein [Nocardioides sp. GY 10127]